MMNVQVLYFLGHKVIKRVFRDLKMMVVVFQDYEMFFHILVLFQDYEENLV
ncbi:hypothetical protein GLOIN_2v1555081, partial [Rhizophagus irregularis DAOM 181602=DAOM 197198]